MCLWATQEFESLRERSIERKKEREREVNSQTEESAWRDTHTGREKTGGPSARTARVRTYVRKLRIFRLSQWVRWNRMKEEPRTGASPGPPASWSIETRRSTGHVHVCTRFLVLFFVSLFRDESRFVALTAGGVGEAIGEVVEILELFEIEKKERIGGERIELFDGNLWNYIIWIFADFWILCVNIVRRDREFRGLYGKFGG